MIISLRKYIQGRGFRVFLYIMIATMGGLFSFLEIVRRYIVSRKDWVIQVNGTKVTSGYLARKVEQQKLYIRHFKDQYGSYAEQFLQLMGMSNPEKTAIRLSIQDKLLNQAFSFLPQSSSPEYIKRMMYNFLFIQEQGSDLLPFQAFNSQTAHFDMARVAQFHLQFGFTLDDFYKQLQEAIVRHQGLTMVQLSYHMPLFDQKRRYAQQYAKKKFSIMRVSLDTYLKISAEQEINPDELRTFFETQNRTSKRYWVPETRSAIVWKLKPNDYGITVTSDEIEEYYQNQKSRLFLDTPLQMQVRSILIKVSDKSEETGAEKHARELHAKLIKNPEEFAHVAQTESQDIQTAKRGGLSDFFSKNTHEYDFEKTAFLLKNNGDISPVIRTKRGFEIIQRIDRRTPVYKSLDLVHDTIVNSITKKKFHTQIAQDLKSLLTANKKEEVERFMEEKKATKEIIIDMANDNSVISKNIFRLSIGKKTFFNDKQEDTIFLELTDIKKKYVPALTEVFDKVKQDFIDQRAEKGRQLYVETIRKEALIKDFSQITTDHPIIQTDWVDKNSYSNNSDLKNIPENLLIHMERIGATVTFPIENNIFIVRLDDQELINETALQVEKMATIKQEMQEEARVIESGFVASLLRHATIKENESSIQT